MNIKPRRNHHITPSGEIVAHNFLSAELPEITVTIKSGRTTYRFTGSYDGARSLSAKLLDHMEKDSEKG